MSKPKKPKAPKKTNKLTKTQAMMVMELPFKNKGLDRTMQILARPGQVVLRFPQGVDNDGTEAAAMVFQGDNLDNFLVGLGTADELSQDLLHPPVRKDLH